MNDKIKLNRPDFYQQFHNLDKHHDSSNYSRKEWYEWDQPDESYAFASGGAVEETAEPEKVKLSDHFK